MQKKREQFKLGDLVAYKHTDDIVGIVVGYDPLRDDSFNVCWQSRTPSGRQTWYVNPDWIKPCVRK